MRIHAYILAPQCAFHDHQFYLRIFRQFNQISRPYYTNTQPATPNLIACLYTFSSIYIHILHVMHIYTCKYSTSTATHQYQLCWIYLPYCTNKRFALSLLLAVCYENGNVSRVPLNSSPSIFPTAQKYTIMLFTLSLARTSVWIWALMCFKRIILHPCHSDAIGFAIWRCIGTHCVAWVCTIRFFFLLSFVLFVAIIAENSSNVTAYS